MSNIKITETDFFEIKENLKNFLKQQNEFKDYDFEGSGLQVLLDLLSANTYYNSIYQNMIVNESFLDSAILRESVVSKAKALGYVPRSTKCSQATIKIQMKEDIKNNKNPVQPEYIVLPQYSKFFSNYDNSSFVFTNIEEKYLLASSSYVDNTGTSRKLYEVTLDIFQGIRNQQSFTIDYNNNPDQRFIIPNSQVDVDTLKVHVKESSESNSEFIYEKAGNISSIGPNDRVYWIIENENGNYEIEFGNGRIGKKLLDSSEVFIEYLISEGSLSNNFKTFFWKDVINVVDSLKPDNSSSYSIFSIETLNESTGGEEKESIEEIKFSAPKSYESQNRAVTASDYKFIVENKYKFVDSVKTWGGEDNDPPEYGKIFICLNPKSGYFITNSLKDSIKNDIVRGYNVVTITPEIVDSYYTDIILDSEVKYNLNQTNKGENYIKSLIIEELKKFNEGNLKKFDSYFRFSKMIGLIDNSHESVKSNTSKIKIRNSLSLFLDVSHTYKTNFNNSLVEGTMSTNQFRFLGKDNCSMEDSGGKISVFSLENGIKKLLKSNIGTVDYISGKVVLNNVKFENLEGFSGKIDITFEPLKLDLIPYNNQIFVLDYNNINITMNNISNLFLK